MDIKFSLTDNSGEVLDELHKGMKTALEAVGVQAVSNAKDALHDSPKRIDTGLLRNSIAYALDGEAPSISRYTADKPRAGKTEKESGTYGGTLPAERGEDLRAVYIGTNVEYAQHVHEGTKRMAPNRFLKKAAESYSSEYKAIIEEILGGK